MTARRTKTRHAKAADRPEPQADGKCFCGAAATLGSDFCMAHTVGDWIADATRKARRRGDSTTAAAWQFAGVLADGVFKHGPKAYMAYTIREQQKKATAAAKPDPFALLQLDAKTATVQDVRRVQRELAKIYHNDVAGSGLAGDAMSNINIAAEEAIKKIKARGGPGTF